MDIETSTDLSALQPCFQGRVLVVDDSPTNCLVFSRQLSDLGFKVATADNGLEAIEKALSQSFDLIFMDIMMPQMDGLEAIRRLREQHLSLPIVALSGKNHPQEQQACLEAGFTACLDKVFTEEEMDELIRNLLSARNYSDQKLDHVVGVSHTGADTTDKAIQVEWLWQMYHDADLISQILDVFRQDAVVALDRLEEAVNTNNEKDLEGWSHKLAGSAGVIRAIPLSEAARQLEKAAFSGDRILVSRLFSQVQQAFRSLREELTKPTLLVREE